ncbi:MAG: hypothetical protein ACXVSL_18165 [Solirubrobacteraceae bacterium]
MIAFTSIAANLIAIGGGLIVFHDSVGHGAPQISGRMLAFALVIAGAAVMPAPRGRADPQDLGPTSDAAAQRSVWT